jgi:hypothetical protein
MKKNKLLLSIKLGIGNILFFGVLPVLAISLLGFLGLIIMLGLFIVNKSANVIVLNDSNLLPINVANVGNNRINDITIATIVGNSNDCKLTINDLTVGFFISVR